MKKNISYYLIATITVGFSLVMNAQPEQEVKKTMAFTNNKVTKKAIIQKPSDLTLFERLGGTFLGKDERLHIQKVLDLF